MVLFGSLKGINEEAPVVVELLGVELRLVLELGSLNGMRELLLLTVELTGELDTVGVTVEVFTVGVLDSPVCFLK